MKNLFKSVSATGNSIEFVWHNNLEGFSTENEEERKTDTNNNLQPNQEKQKETKK